MQSDPQVSARGQVVATPPANAAQAQDDRLRGGGEPPSWPLTSVEDTRKYLATEGSADVLITHTFSDALIEALYARGEVAMTVDWRDAEHGKPHFKGDMQLVVPLKRWKAVFCVGPPCYQHLRGDIRCLQSKVDDCRAYWAGAMVCWCLCQISQYAVVGLLEQPDVLAHDHLDVASMEHAHVRELRTSLLGDSKCKFMRLTVWNGELPTIEAADAYTGIKDARPSHVEYRDDDARDRARSTWEPYVKTAAWVARLGAVRSQGVPALNFDTVITRFASAWYQAGRPLPPGFANPSGQPLDEGGRQYQLVRGKGDGRRPRAMPGELTSIGKARVAEAGDQVVAVCGRAALLRLMDQKARKGERPTPAQWEAYVRML